MLANIAAGLHSNPSASVSQAGLVTRTSPAPRWAANAGFSYSSPSNLEGTSRSTRTCAACISCGMASPRRVPPSSIARRRRTCVRLGNALRLDAYAGSLRDALRADLRRYRGRVLDGDRRRWYRMAIPLLRPPSGTRQSPRPFFRRKLDRLYISQFQSVSAGRSRDLALIFNYGLAATRTVVTVEARNAGVPDARHEVRRRRRPPVRGARPGDYKSANLIALQSAWMPVPGVEDYDPRATVDVVAYVAEITPEIQCSKQHRPSTSRDKRSMRRLSRMSSPMRVAPSDK